MAALIVVVAEKPSVARDLARVLAPGARPADGALVAAEAGVAFTWAYGHLLELAPPEHYDPALRRWRLETLPILPARFALVPRGETAAPRTSGRGGTARRRRGADGVGRGADPRRQLARIRALLTDPATTEVVNACDSGREGERIFREILSVVRPRAVRVTRLWLSETTPAAVRKAWRERKDAAHFDRLAAAADARAEADWLVGMNATRALTVRHRAAGRGLLTAGRVQTPTLALLAAREQAIRSFRPEAYFTVEAHFALVADAGSIYPAVWIGRHRIAPDPWRRAAADAADGADRAEPADVADAADDTGPEVAPAPVTASPAPADGAAAGLARRLSRREEAEAVVARLAGRDGAIAVVARRDRPEPPPVLYNLNDLQRAANRALGLTARETLAAAQRLYEAGHLSYPRTDSRHLTPELAATIPSRFAACGLPAPAVAPARAGCVDAARVGDHHGLLPTERPPGEGTSRVDRAVWRLVATRAAAAFQTAALWQDTHILTQVGDDWLLSEARRLAHPGWRGVEPPPNTAAATRSGRGDAQAAPPVALPPAVLAAVAPTPVVCRDAATVEHATRPPARYTDASLLGAMEHAGRTLDDGTLRRAMAGAGLGTAATRAEILESLIRRGYVQREGRSLVPTEAGEALVRAAPPELRSAELTARWEGRLAAIERGEEAPDAFAAAIAAFVRATVAAVAAAPALEPAPAAADGPGPAAIRRGGRARPDRRPPAARRGAERAPKDDLGAADAAPRAAADTVLGCPRCGGAMERSRDAWRCQGACHARIPRRLFGRATLWSDVTALLTVGHTPLRRGFVTASGARAAAHLRLRPDGRVEVAWAASQPPEERPKRARVAAAARARPRTRTGPGHARRARTPRDAGQGEVGG